MQLAGIQCTICEANILFEFGFMTLTADGLVSIMKSRKIAQFR